MGYCLLLITTKKSRSEQAKGPSLKLSQAQSVDGRLMNELLLQVLCNLISSDFSVLHMKRSKNKWTV